MADTRWQAKITQQSTTEEDDGSANPEYMIAQGAMIATYSGDDDKEVYKPTPPDATPDAHLVAHTLLLSN